MRSGGECKKIYTPGYSASLTNASPKNPVYALSATNFVNSMVAVQTGVPEQLAACTNLTTTSSA